MLRSVIVTSASLVLAFSVSANSDFQNWLRQQQNEFQTYVDEQDKEFGQFLKARWVETEVKPQQQRDKQPKPKVIPKAKPQPVVPIQPTVKPFSTPERKPLVRPDVLPKDADKPKPRINPVPNVQPEPKKSPLVTTKPEITKQPKLVVKPKSEQKPKAEPKPKVDPKPQVRVTPNNESKVTPPKAPVVAPILIPTPKRSPSKLDFSAANKTSVKISFLGQKLKMPKVQFKPLSLYNVDSKSIAAAWMTMAKTSYKEQVNALKKAGNVLKLDDWGKALLTHQYLTSQARLNTNHLQLYSWFYLVKQGFDSRVAYNKQQVFLMLNVEQKLYGQNYSTISGNRYYFVDLASKRPVKVGRVFTYDKQHSAASDAVTIDLSIAPLQAKANKTRKLQTKVGQKTIQASAPYNLSYVEYLDHYPQLNMKYYFEAELPIETKQRLLADLKPYLKGLSEEESLNLILRFVQTSLKYQTDDQQFKRENYLFAGETLHYPYADCEDRAVLYAYLVKKLLGNQVIGLQYDGHIATAVAVSSNVRGDSYKIDGKNFVVADPTFINANIGQTMTGYVGKSPKIIRF